MNYVMCTNGTEAQMCDTRGAGCPLSDEVSDSPTRYASFRGRNTYWKSWMHLLMPLSSPIFSIFGTNNTLPTPRCGVGCCIWNRRTKRKPWAIDGGSHRLSFFILDTTWSASGTVNFLPSANCSLDTVLGTACVGEPTTGDSSSLSDQCLLRKVL